MAASTNKPFTISRGFDAPRDLVFAAWTERDHLLRWFGPKGFTMVEARLDLRPGGSFHYGLRAPDGAIMWGKWTFRDIVRPERITLISSFSDADGGVTRHPFAPGWPRFTLSTTRFEEKDGRTIVTVEWSPHEADAAEIAVFEAGRASMNIGWTGTFDQLEAYLNQTGKTGETS